MHSASPAEQQRLWLECAIRVARATAEKTPLLAALQIAAPPPRRLRGARG